MTSEKLEQIRSRLSTLDAIPTIPVVIQPLLAMLQTPIDDVDLKKVKELISYDNTIAALCLRVANSPLFGRRTVETVSEAIVALGMKRVQSIVLSCALTQVVPASQWAMDAVTYWRHCLGCALVCRKMATLIGSPDTEKAYLARLLHDLGILVNSLVCTDEYARVCSMPPVRACRSTKRKKKSWASPIAKPENSWPSSGTYPPISPR